MAREEGRDGIRDFGREDGPASIEDERREISGRSGMASPASDVMLRGRYSDCRHGMYTGRRSCRKRRKSETGLLRHESCYGGLFTTNLHVSSSSGSPKRVPGQDNPHPADA